jgi:hypothetical protein
MLGFPITRFAHQKQAGHCDVIYFFGLKTISRMGLTQFIVNCNKNSCGSWFHAISGAQMPKLQHVQVKVLLSHL